MPKRTSKKPSSDINLVALSVVRRATENKPNQETSSRKNPAAVALGKLGGKIGGAARARALSAKRRSEIASLAARSRWKREKGAS